MARSMRVDYSDGTSRWYPLPPGKGWKVNVMDRTLLIGVPSSHRLIVPLDRVDAFQVEETNADSVPAPLDPAQPGRMEP